MVNGGEAVLHHPGPTTGTRSFRRLDGVGMDAPFLYRRFRRVMVVRGIPLPLVMVLLLQTFWIFFDRSVTSQTYFPPPRRYIPPTESSPLSPFYGPEYDTFQGPIRVFPAKTFPCQELLSETKFGNPGPVWKTAFLYVKQAHSAGTTVSGITSRISRNVAQRTHRIPTNRTTTTTTTATACATWNAALRARRLSTRIKDQSFLWSVVREPVDRMVSRFFHEAVSLDGTVGSVENFQRFVENSASLEYGASLRTLTMRSFRRHMSPFGSVELFQQYAGEILDEYDFLGILERLHESLATLQLLLGLETQDMLYLTTRSSEGFGGASYTTLVNPTTRDTKCVKLHPKQVSLPFKEFLYQPFMFEEVFEADVYLYKAINKSLDATIESLGQEQVDRAVKRLIWGQKRVEERCSKTTTFPCSDEGSPPRQSTDCLVDDVGCGYQCIDSIGMTMAEDPDFLQI